MQCRYSSCSSGHHRRRIRPKTTIHRTTNKESRIGKNTTGSQTYVKSQCSGSLPYLSFTSFHFVSFLYKTITDYSQREAPTIEGTWVRNQASGPEIYVGNNGNQRYRDEQAYYGHCYSEAIAKLREKTFKASDRGVPIEYFTWERVVVDECHESLVTGRKLETNAADFKEKSRRGAREFLGVAQTDIAKRPLLAARAVWGLTGTPLLETEARVTELANLM